MHGQFHQQLRNNLETFCRIAPGTKIVLAVSGGLDSMVLLHSIAKLADPLNLKIVVAHLDHALRGDQSTADAEFVSTAAGSLGIPCFVGKADVRSLATSTGDSLEMAGRKARHDWLVSTALQHRFSTVAMAHHADDQVELFFLRLLRGAGSEGLNGMRWNIPFPAHPEISLVRPLLNFTKEQLSEYAQANRIKYHEDQSNASLEFDRNRIRHQLIPLLRQSFQPALTDCVLRAMDLIGSDGDFVAATAGEWLGRPRSRPQKSPSLTPFNDLPIAVQRAVVKQQLLAMAAPPTFQLIESLRVRPGLPVSVSVENWAVRDEAGRVTFWRPAAGEFQDFPLLIALGEASGAAVYERCRIEWRFEHGMGKHLPAPCRNVETFDAEKVGGEVVVRHWRRGDRFQPSRMPKPVKLQDLFVNLKIPRSGRHELLVACAADGEIFWVEGLRISERFKLSSTTQRRLIWTWKRA